MKMKYPMAILGGILLVSGCNPNDNQSAPSVSSATNEVREAGKNAPVAAVATNLPPVGATNSESVPK